MSQFHIRWLRFLSPVSFEKSLRLPENFQDFRKENTDSVVRNITLFYIEQGKYNSRDTGTDSIGARCFTSHFGKSVAYRSLKLMLVTV